MEQQSLKSFYFLTNDQSNLISLQNLFYFCIVFVPLYFHFYIHSHHFSLYSTMNTTFHYIQIIQIHPYPSKSILYFLPLKAELNYYAFLLMKSHFHQSLVTNTQDFLSLSLIISYQLFLHPD